MRRDSFAPVVQTLYDVSSPELALRNEKTELVDPTYSGLPVTAAARSKAWTVFARSHAGIVGSDPTQGIDVCVLLFCV
jgi:hypothetical protein